MSKNFLSITIVLGSIILLGQKLSAQVNRINIPEELELNTITTAVPFLTISPDARGGALGDAGVSTSPDANSIHWNPSKLAFMEGNGGVSITYSPWLRTLVNDISLSYVSSYWQVSDIATMGASLRYFSLGDITFTDIQGNVIGDFTPNEWSLDLAYAMQLSENYSFGMAVRYINSNLTQGITVNGQDTRPARSIAADVSGFYTNDEIQLGDYDATLRVGANISNIGAKMRYTSNDESDFLPTMIRIGPSLTLDLDEYNKITFLVEATKLLVPTPPIYRTDSTGTIITDDSGDPVILAGNDPDVSIVSGMFGSFSDAPGLITGFDDADNPIIEPGSVRREELREINISTGIEYWYDNQFAVRMGYFYEHPTKGNRQYLTVGMGLKLSVFSIDVAYLIGNVQRNPLANTARFSLKFDFDAFTDQNTDDL